MKIIACNSNLPLSEAIATYLNLPLTQASVRRFADMECFVEIHENVRGEDVFILQSTSYPANDHLMELLVSLDAVRRGAIRDHADIQNPLAIIAKCATDSTDHPLISAAEERGGRA